jgi:phosphate starvation-inducible PhoH-like protein
MAKARRPVSKAARQAARKKTRQDKKEKAVAATVSPVEFKPRTRSQAAALKLIEQNDISFLIGSAGSGKTFLAMAYAINQILDGRKTKIVLTRPIVEAGEKLGFLPGTFGEKVNPYMQPLYDAMDALLGKYTAARDIVNKSVVLAPLCYMRGRTFNDSICIFDEAQNATYTQLKLFLSRFGENSKVIVTGDPDQSDLFIPNDHKYCALTEVYEKVQKINGIGVIKFANSDVVRHPLVGKILEEL